jgi:hypothetical protein
MQQNGVKSAVKEYDFKKAKWRTSRRVSLENSFVIRDDVFK